MRGAALCTALCTAGDCAVLQPGNGEAEAPGSARWVLRSHNDTMAFSLSKTPLPMILEPSWNSELLICVIRKKSRWAPTITRGAGVDSLGARDLAYTWDTIDVLQSVDVAPRHHLSNTQRLT
jgi:hypothetical protein